MVGKVKWFSAIHGYGFIDGEADEDIFVHYSAIDANGYRALKGGQSVEFEVQDGPRGPAARNVRAVS